MIAVPFIYFSCLFVFIYKKKGFDLSAYLVLIYVLISFFAILIDVNNLRTIYNRYYTISIEASVVYCFLLTMIIYPFYQINFKKINFIKLEGIKLFDKIVYLYFTSFLLLLITSFSNLKKILTGDLGELRTMVYNGEVVVQNNSLGPLSILINLLSMFSIIMLLFYFYSICFLNKSKKYNAMILLSSLSIIIIGILGIDRSKTFYWMITYGAMVVLFWRYMKVKQRKQIKLITIILVSLLATYFLAMTISRFGERDQGTEGGIISYAGQSYINFCMFYDTIVYPEFSLQRIFPVIYHFFVDNGIENSQDLNDEIGRKTGTFIGVFSTFAGDIMVASGKIATFLYCFVYFIIANQLLSFKKRIIYFHDLIFLFLLLLVPLLGIFVHFYSNYHRMMVVIFLILYALYMKISYIKRNEK